MSLNIRSVFENAMTLHHSLELLIAVKISISLRRASKGVVCGDKILWCLNDKQKEIFRIKKDWDLPGDFKKMGLKREDVNYVILTHSAKLRARSTEGSR